MTGIQTYVKAVVTVHDGGDVPSSDPDNYKCWYTLKPYSILRYCGGGEGVID